jgi:hypothetical protein
MNNDIKGQPGESIYKAAQRAIHEARQRGSEVALIFNETRIIVNPLSFDGDIGSIYMLRRKIEELTGRPHYMAE